MCQKEKNLNGVDHKSGANKLWSTIRNLNGSKGKSNANKLMTFGTIITSIPNKCANLFNQHFTPHPPTIDDSKRAVLRKIRQLPKDSVEYTTNEVSETITSTKKSKALGSDNLTPIHLHYLGPEAIQYLTQLLNLSIMSTVIPQNWRTGRVIPLLKPGKNPEESKSYRPIALISPVTKLPEKLTLPELERQACGLPTQVKKVETHHNGIELSEPQHQIWSQQIQTVSLHSNGCSGLQNSF